MSHKLCGYFNLIHTYFRHVQTLRSATGKHVTTSFVCVLNATALSVGRTCTRLGNPRSCTRWKVEHVTPAPPCTPLSGAVAATPTCGWIEVRPRTRCMHSGAQCFLHEVSPGRVRARGAGGFLSNAYARMDGVPGGCQPTTSSLHVRIPRGTTPWLWVHRRTSFRDPSTRVCSQRPVVGCRARAHPSHSPGPSRGSTVPSTVHHQSLNERTDFGFA